MKKTSRIAVLLVGFAAFSVQAQTTTHTAISHTTFGTVSDEVMANHWGLKTSEAKKYRTYMAVEGKYFYAHLDPIMVLGIIEADPATRARYAEKYLVAERERVEQQTGFAALVAATQLKRFGREPVFDFSTLPQAANSPEYLEARAARRGARRAARTAPPLVSPTTVHAGDTVDLLISADCGPPCEEKLAQILQTTEVRVLLYGRDFKETAALVAWLKQWAATAPAERAPVATRIQPRRFDPVVFSGIDLSTLPVTLLRRNGVVVGTL